MVLYQVMLYCIKSYHILYSIIYISIKSHILYVYIYIILYYIILYCIILYYIIFISGCGYTKKKRKNWNSTLDGIVHQLAVAGKISQK